jgi:hypothetical protein
MVKFAWGMLTLKKIMFSYLSYRRICTIEICVHKQDNISDRNESLDCCDVPYSKLQFRNLIGVWRHDKCVFFVR